MSRLMFTTCMLLIPSLAWADVAPGGCRCASTELGLAALPVLVVAGMALIRRFRRGC